MSLFQTLVTRHSGTPLGSPALVRRRREEQLLDKEDKEDKEEEVDKEEVHKCGKEILGLLSPVVIR